MISAACTVVYDLWWGAKDKNSIYIVNVNFSKIVAFKGTIRKFLSVVAAHTVLKA
jgi:hypothetical protein